jgi:hypothetical protein
MLRDDVTSPVRREIVSTPDLGCASSFASRIGDRAICSARESGETIGAVDISAIELRRIDRRASVRVDVMLTKRRRRWQMPAGRREALARMHHLATAEISRRHGMKGSSRTASGVSAAAKTTTTEASAASVMASRLRLRLRDQGRARNKGDPIEFSFHVLNFLCVLLLLKSFG